MTMGRIILLLAFAVSLSANAQKLLPLFNVDENGLWVEGHDPVAYFTEGRARKGSAQFTTTYRGATFRFVSAGNKALFVKTPDRFLPKYGGWCAFAMGDSGTKVEVDPETFKIKEGELYLFYNAFFTNTLTSWNKSELKLKVAAERNWSKLKHAP